MFLHLSVILFTEGDLPDRDHPLNRTTPEQRPLLDRDPPEQTPLDRDPLDGDPLDRDPLGQRTPGHQPPVW